MILNNYYYLIILGLILLITLLKEERYLLKQNLYEINFYYLIKNYIS